MSRTLLATLPLPPDGRRALRWLGWVLLVVMCLAVAGQAFVYLWLAYQPRNPFHVSFAQAGWAVPLHFYAAGLALLLLPLQFSTRLRNRWPTVHRTGGGLYLACVLIGGISGLLLAPRSQGGMATVVGFSLIALIWLYCSGLALYYVVRGQYALHRRWMLRSAAVTFAAVTLRIYLGLGVAVLGLDFRTVYIVACWLCWSGNLLAVEIYLRFSERSAQADADARRRQSLGVSPDSRLNAVLKVDLETNPQS